MNLLLVLLNNLLLLWEVMLMFMLPCTSCESWCEGCCLKFGCFMLCFNLVQVLLWWVPCLLVQLLRWMLLKSCVVCMQMLRLLLTCAVVGFLVLIMLMLLCCFDRKIKYMWGCVAMQAYKAHVNNKSIDCIHNTNTYSSSKFKKTQHNRSDYTVQNLYQQQTKKSMILELKR